MRLNAKGQLGVGERCIEADGQGVKYAFCRLGTVDGPWQYDDVSLLFLNKNIKQVNRNLSKHQYMLICICRKQRLYYIEYIRSVWHFIPKLSNYL